MEKNNGNLFTLRYKITESGFYVGVIKELPGVLSQGESKEELLANITDAIRAMLYVNLRDNEESFSESITDGDEITEEKIGNLEPCL